MTPGILGKKLGMSQIFAPQGSLMGVTVVEAGPCVITQVRQLQTDGYTAIQLGFGQPRRLNKPERGHLKGMGEFRHLREFRVEDPSPFQVGQRVEVGEFQPGERVEVTGISKGKGFAGGVKRHHFAGGPKTHGQSDRWRAPGSIGTTGAGRVLKGKKMAGHMGDMRVTTKNLEVVRVEPERHLLFLLGAVPGGKNGLLLIRRAGGAK